MKGKKKIISLITSVAILGVLTLLGNAGIIDIDIQENNEDNITVNSNKENKANTVGRYKVTRVVDGDTFIINYNGKEERVRLIGVDTPESVHPNESKNTEEGIKVSDYTKQMLTGKYVEIELDVSQRDKYGRLLVYAYLDGEMYNKTLLEKGYARIATYPPNVKYVEDFTRIQKEARENKVGLWSE